MTKLHGCYHEPRVHDHELYNSLNRSNVFGLFPLAILGIIFNTCALICLYRPPRITSGVFVYLAALLILDHCQLVATTAVVLIPQFCDSQYLPAHTFYSTCMFERRFLRYLLPRIEMTISTLHVWAVAALSAHRYWKISRPVKSRMNDTVFRARSVLTGIFLLAMIFRIPVFLFELRFKWIPRSRITTNADYTEVLSIYRLIYHSVLDPLLSNVVPFLWMSLFSLMTLQEVFRSRKLNYQQITTEIGMRNDGCSDITKCHTIVRLNQFRKKSDIYRQKQEQRATISIVLIILFYLALHSLQLYTIMRKWQLLFEGACPRRIDYVLSHVSVWLSLASASVNAFVFIAFTNKLRSYVQKLIRKTSRTLSSSTDPPLSPKSTNTVSTHPPNDNPFNV